MKRALITGITGQDGSYLAELLLQKGYEVYGLQRRTSTPNTLRIDHIYDNPAYPNFYTLYGDMADSSSITRVLEQARPDEIYNLAAQSHVKVSFDVPESTANITGVGALRILDAIRTLKLQTRFYQASSSEMFGKVLEVPQTEKTPFNPQSPYGAAKVFAYYITRVYRTSYNVFAANGILFNHESPRRGITFVTRKITLGLARVKLGLQKTLLLGNLDSKRDWGFAGDYVEAMWLMLQQDAPDDYLVATGETHTVRSFVEEVGRHLDMQIEWEGKGIEEKGIDRKSGKVVIAIDPVYFRPAEVDLLIGDSSKARKALGWKPKVTFTGLAAMMAEADYKLVQGESDAGKKVEVHFPRSV